MVDIFKDVKPTYNNILFILMLAEMNGCSSFFIPARTKKGAIRLANAIRNTCECKVKFDTNNMTWITEIIFGNGTT